MSRSFFRYSAWTVPALLIVASALAPRGYAQDNPDELSPFQQALQSKISIEFPGGVLVEYVNEIRELAPTLNIVMTETAASHRLPEIRLVDVPVRGALSLLSTLTNSQATVEFQLQADSYDADIVLISAPDLPPPSRSTEVRVFNVKQLLGASNREALLSALESGYEMLGSSGSPVDVKIHEATGLLFIKGSPEQLQLAEAVIREIQHEMNPTVSEDNPSQGSLPFSNESFSPPTGTLK